jgi:hypothetical protein
MSSQSKRRGKINVPYCRNCKLSLTYKDIKMRYFKLLTKQGYLLDTKHLCIQCAHKVVMYDYHIKGR